MEVAPAPNATTREQPNAQRVSHLPLRRALRLLSETREDRTKALAPEPLPTPRQRLPEDFGTVRHRVNAYLQAIAERLTPEELPTLATLLRKLADALDQPSTLDFLDRSRAVGGRVPQSAGSDRTAYLAGKAAAEARQ